MIIRNPHALYGIQITGCWDSRDKLGDMTAVVEGRAAALLMARMACLSRMDVLGCHCRPDSGQEQMKRMLTGADGNQVTLRILMGSLGKIKAVVSEEGADVLMQLMVSLGCADLPFCAQF